MITSDRCVFVAAHVTQPIKDTLRRMAAKRGRSMSEFISEAVEEKLQREIAEDVPLLAGLPSKPFSEFAQGIWGRSSSPAKSLGEMSFTLHHWDGILHDDVIRGIQEKILGKSDE